MNYLENLAPLVLEDAEVIGAFTVNVTWAIAFYEGDATRRAGIIPDGTAVQPIARIDAQYVNMMLVQGEQFELFIDYQFTTVSEEEFLALPTIDEIMYETACDADWCENSG